MRSCKTKVRRRSAPAPPQALLNHKPRLGEHLYHQQKSWPRVKNISHCAPRGIGGGALDLAACRRAFSLEITAFAFADNSSQAPEALRARVFARSGSPVFDFGSPGGSQARFWTSKRLDSHGFSTFARGRCVHCPRLTKHCVGA